MTTITNQDIEHIRAWLAKDDTLPKDFTDFMIRKFLHSCYGSLEQTKKCIERFCIGRYNMPELYTNRDPMSAKVQTAFSITSVASFNAGKDELLLHQLDDPNLEKFDFYDILKSFCLQADYWIHDHPVISDGQIILLDIQHYHLKIIPKINIFYVRQFFLFLLEAMPIRLKKIHVYNCPPYYEKLYLLVKPVLPQEICDVITFHASASDLHKVIDKTYLPKELGGDAPSMRKLAEDRNSQIEANRKFFMNEDLWKAKQSKSKNIDNCMNGSFRTLSID